ncbi:MAG: dTDP-4-dehydrorhamnose 3,5-epimerase [SAR324 cluster bacterium]|nr:dTDP-4-dehydrorhamnose 3,5-epimerase [SAR324 cluster bacterium]
MFQITPAKIPDIKIIQPQVFGDNRGYFFESYTHSRYEFNGTQYSFLQDNESKSVRGVLRGLHYQLEPYAQSKLVRVILGEVLDVAVDIRKGSPTFGQHFSIVLSETNKTQVLIPSGFAHGFVTLSETAIFSYKVDNYYHPTSDRGIKFDDPALAIDWQIDPEKIQLSEKDQKQPLFSDAEYFKLKGEM